MEQSKFYKYIIVGLVGLNIAVLAFFSLSKPRPPHELSYKNNRAEVIEILHLDDQQATQLKRLADEHVRSMEEFKVQQAAILSPYFISVIDSGESNGIDSLLFQKYQESEKAKIELTYKHFQQIKELLREDQYPYFQKFVHKTVDRVLVGEKKEMKRRN